MKRSRDGLSSIDSLKFHFFVVHVENGGFVKIFLEDFRKLGAE